MNILVILLQYYLFNKIIQQIECEPQILSTGEKNWSQSKHTNSRNLLHIVLFF